MNTNFIEHLRNLKIYSDWRNSELSTWDIFMDLKDQGKSTKIEQSYNPYKDQDSPIETGPRDEIEPTADQIKAFRQKPERNYLEEYCQFIEDEIIRLLELYDAPIPNIFDLNDLPYIVCYKYSPLADFMETNENQVLEYVELMKLRRSSDFFAVMEDLQFEMVAVKSSIWSKIFTSLKAYLFLQELTENIENRGRDLSFFYRRMKEENLIKASITTYESWLEKEKLPISKTLRLKESRSTQREKLYTEIRKKYLPF